MFTLHQSGLFLHFVALFILGGATISGIIMERQLWQKALAGSHEGKTLFPLMQGAEKLVKIGAILFLLSGIIMLGSVRWVYFSQPWFLVKVTLFFVLAARGAIVSKPILQETERQLNQDSFDQQQIRRLRFRMNRFHVVQYTISAVIIFLVLFKP